MSGPLEMSVPMPLNIANGQHGSWGQRHRDKVRYWEMLDGLQLIGKIPPPPARPFERAKIRSTMYLGSPMDDSNAMRRHKWVEDWLKTRGYIVDDRKKNLRWEGFPEQVITRGTRALRKIDLVLTPLGAAA